MLHLLVFFDNSGFDDYVMCVHVMWEEFLVLVWSGPGI